ncbi:hypothetical protein MRB53_020260 [Persea americana]|uniref:Uncharacterized protein n=1 Tax=Persea americana TaxID=3435 RepID=A0ACC2L1Q3_PERAE|nr:hypothetical protein MRB53_020260 [Persea americana]
MNSNRLFPLKIESVQSCLVAKVNDPSWLWHFRYGHLSFGGLKTLQQKNMVTGLPQISIPSQVCEECVVSKQHRSQFPKGKSWRAKDEKRKKLDDKGEKCVFLGVSEASKAYKSFNPVTKKIVTSRDVVFDEENIWDWERQQTQVLFDNDSEKEPSPAAFMPENPPEATPTATEILPTVAKATDTAAQSLRRTRKRPAWMEDYETKPLKLATFVKLRGLLGVCSHDAVKKDFAEN